MNAGMENGILLYELAHARSGDKGNRLNIGVVARDPRYYPYLAKALTPDTVRFRFAHRHPTKVMRYDLPLLNAFNFVLDDVLDGGVNSSTGLDAHGKSLSFLLLGTLLDLPRSLLGSEAASQTKTRSVSSVAS